MYVFIYPIVLFCLNINCILRFIEGNDSLTFVISRYCGVHALGVNSVRTSERRELLLVFDS